MGLGKKFTKKCAQSYVSSLWRLYQVLDRTYQSFYKNVCPVTRFFAVETNLNFWWDLEKFSQKKVSPVTRFFAVETILSFWGDLESFDKMVWPVTHFFRSADYLKFLMGLGKVFTEKCAQLHVLFALETILSLDRTWKSFDKNVWPVTHFFRSADYLKFLMGLGKVFTKKCAQLHVLFAVQTILSFWWNWKDFHKKSVPSHMFLRCGD